jgi:hypothetical protein
VPTVKAEVGGNVHENRAGFAQSKRVKFGSDLGDYFSGSILLLYSSFDASETAEDFASGFRVWL